MDHDHTHGDGDHMESHSEGVYKGLGAVAGIYVFFVIEKIMQMRRAKKEKRHIHEELSEEDHNEIYHSDMEHEPNGDNSKSIFMNGESVIDDLTPGASKKKTENGELDVIVIHANKGKLNSSFSFRV